MLSRKSFGSRAKVGKVKWGLVLGTHEIEEYKTRVAADEQNEIAETIVARRERPADVGVDTFQQSGGAMGGLVGEGCTSDISFCADGAGFRGGVVELGTLGSRLKSFNAYVTH